MLSVLPGSIVVISAHLLPNLRWASKILIPSSSVIGPLLISGLRWLFHLSLICFPDRPVTPYSSSRYLAIIAHFLVPCLETRVRIASSWSSLQSCLLAEFVLVSDFSYVLDSSSFACPIGDHYKMKEFFEFYSILLSKSETDLNLKPLFKRQWFSSSLSLGIKAGPSGS